MKQHITDEHTGLSYELAGNYYLPMLQIETGAEPIGIWGQRYRKYLREHRKGLYASLLLSGRLDDELRNMDRQADEMFDLIVHQTANREGVTEALKDTDQMAWVGAMNNIRSRAEEIVTAMVESER